MSEIPLRRDSKWWGWGKESHEPSIDAKLLAGELGELSAWRRPDSIDAVQIPVAAPLPEAMEQTVGADNVFAQSDQIARNVLVALAAVGARPEHVVSAVIYVVSDDEGVLAHVVQHFRQSAIATAFTSAATLIGVNRLGSPGQLIEVDLTAALPD